MRDWLAQVRYGRQCGYETLFKPQDCAVRGKVGVILADIGVPERYDARFYVQYMEHIYRYSIPALLQPVVLADRGKALIDPANPQARQAFAPARLVDMYGSETNSDGRPYVSCDVTWRGPGVRRNPWDHGYFLFTEEGKAGAPDICQKTAAKIAGWYFGQLLPSGKVPWAYQCARIYEDAVSALRRQSPDAEVRHAAYASIDSLCQNVDELLGEGCETIVYQCFSNPVYSDLEEYNTTFPALHRLVDGRARLVFADQLGNQPALRAAYLEMLRAALEPTPVGCRVLVVLSRHGHPFAKETMDRRAPEYRQPLEEGVWNVLRGWGGYAEVLWSDDEFADRYWDPKHRKFETLAAHQIGIDREFDYVIELPTEFVAENTDTMILHAMKKYTVYQDYDPNVPVEYPDWDQPLVRVFHHRKTTGLYLGCPVGPYRQHVVQAVVSSVLSLAAE